MKAIGKFRLGVVAAAILLGASLTSAQVTLGTAQTFGVLGGASITNTGTSVIDGDVGVSPGTAVTGFPPGIVLGALHVADAVAGQAQSDATTAYDTLAGLAPDFDLTGQDLGGLTLTPGVYSFSSSAQLTGALQLDALGNDEALFVFQIASTLITASNSSVLMINGGTGCNVYWQVGSSATLGTDTSFVGTVIALASISADTSTDVTGRLLALTGSVTLDTNAIAIAESCQATTSDYGDGCAGEGGIVPVLSMGAAIAGDDVTIELTGGLGGSNAIILFGSGPVEHPLKPLSGCGCTLFVRPGPLAVVVPLGGSGAGGGTFTIVVAVPTSAIGVMFAMQVFIPDPSSSCGFSASNALLVTIG
ncbi:MAG: DUF3494 domain-containing protein [Planctomycetes bacterium]|nr:DUF3494 domain-containing protein [Planctomycetota bacterium]